MARSIDALVEEQVRRWQLAGSKKEAEPRPPVITVTGQHGARGDELSRAVASALEFDHFDREIIHLIADRAHLGERVRCRKTRGAGTDNCNGFTGPVFRHFSLHPAVLKTMVDDGMFNVLDGNSRIGNTKHTGTFTRRRANTTGEFREIVRFV